MLKLLACLFMLIDHVGVYAYPFLPESVALACRIIGRLAFPIFAWQIARGYALTRSPLIYFARMTGFAVASEIILRTAHAYTGFPWLGTNVLVTFALAIVLITGLRLLFHTSLDLVASLRPVTPQVLAGKDRFHVRHNPGGLSLDPRLGLFLGLGVLAMTVAAAWWLRPDYGLYGLAAVGLFYMLQTLCSRETLYAQSFKFFLLLNVMFVFVHALTGQMPFDWAMLQSFSVFALPLIERIGQGRKPTFLIKYGFYLFYPTHITALVFLQHFLRSLGS